MTLKEKVRDLDTIEQALHFYSTWFIDWEEMYNTPGYKPKFPDHLLEAEKALKRIAEALASS